MTCMTCGAIACGRGCGYANLISLATLATRDFAPFSGSNSHSGNSGARGCKRRPRLVSKAQKQHGELKTVSETGVPVPRRAIELWLASRAQDSFPR